MLYFAHFLFFLSVGTGLVALYISIQIYRRYKHKYLLSNVYMLAGFNFISLANSTEAFIKTSVSNNLNPNILDYYFTVILFILPLIIIFSLYHFTVFLKNINDENVSGVYKKLAVITGSVFLLSQAIYYSGIFEAPELKYAAIVISNVLLLAVTTVSLVKTLIFVKKAKPLKKRKSLRLFAIVFLSFIVGLLIVAIMGSTGVISLNAQMLLLSLDVFIFNIIVVIFIKTFFKNYYESTEIKDNRFLKLIKEFQISGRENDIIHLICKGKTNKEIGAELFISPLTVRDHISNIFRKTDVKNRTQLASLFSG